ncbi:MAG: triose-phosphate isomerase [Acidobacteria bacterium]|nr:triose-phosphate isomerase [Acidobacteriota bacterium]
MRMLVANWKMNHLRADLEAFASTFLQGYGAHPGVRVGVAPPFPLLAPAWAAFEGRGVEILGQNGHQEAKGAFTGEVSMAQLRDLGCAGVILGHSERRQFFGETDALLARKLPAARSNGLEPLLCVGERLEEREAGRTLEVLGSQLAILGDSGPGPLTLAYEPVWAIGTGRRAEPGQVAEAHHFIRVELVRHLGPAGESVPILYGGSVTPENFDELLAIPNVAGGLVGGASLDPTKFLALVRSAQVNV